MKQRCAEDEAVRTYSEAFLNAICDITGQGRPQQQPHEGGQSDLIALRSSCAVFNQSLQLLSALDIG